ncbi:3-oxoacyl-[acyl-carrier-protein] reductase [compost metagenome]
MDAYLRSQADAAGAEEAVIAQHPVGRLGEPRDIASLATWLASDEASFATGQLFVLDGGLTAHAPFVQGRKL